MRSLWARVRKAHVTFVTTGYLKLMEPIAAVLIRVGVWANALTTLGTLGDRDSVRGRLRIRSHARGRVDHWSDGDR